MKKSHLTLIFVCLVNFVQGQYPMVKIWDKCFGGIYDEILTDLKHTSDGGYILGGSTTSDSSGDISQHTYGQDDFWIVKTDSLGNKEWDKRFGGIEVDIFGSLQQTSDGGFLLGGFTNSDSSVDVSEHTHGSLDYWIIKINSSGFKEWDKRFGGSDVDALYALQQTTDGGFILGGVTFSDSSGDVSQHSKGGGDFWLVKIDSLGNKEWDKIFGGNLWDSFKSLQQTSDGGYILGGYTYSDSSGDVSEFTRDTSQIYARGDYWIVKTDSLGNKEWDKRFGGNSADELYSLMQTSDQGYILGGQTVSSVSGDRTQPLWGVTHDFWIVKTDSLGNKNWDKRFGGFESEFGYGNIILTEDNNYAFAGTSLSSTGGDKTEDNMGIRQTWILKIDTFGTKIWDKTLKIPGQSESGLVIQSNENCYVFANWTNNSGIGGYKSQPSQGWDDYWFIKFCDTTFATPINETLIANSQFSIYPNPFNNEITVKWETGINCDKEIILFDVTGKEILRQKTSEAETKLNTEKLSAGFYLLNCNCANYKLLKF